MLSRTATNTSNGERPPTTPGGSLAPGTGFWAQHEAQVVHQQVVDLANKRINFLDYLRKAHEGRRYWFNTYLFDKPDLARMPLFDPRKMSRKATNYLLLGVSLPVVVDLYSSNAQEFLRSMNQLLAEFDSFQQLHSDSASRNRLPNMFRRPGVKSRRSTSNTDVHSVAEESFAGPSPGGLNTAPASVMNFAASESDLLPGEEYTHLLTPALPFEPDYFETFATLCDVLIDCYTRLLNLMPTPRECSSQLAEQFSKMDGKIKKLIFQGVVKEFEDHSRSSIKTEVANIGKVVLSGLM
ncbi:hypothetical protein CC79DRAFT_1278592 [Sarocladium strictum]